MKIYFYPKKFIKLKNHNIKTIVFMRKFFFKFAYSVTISRYYNLKFNLTCKYLLFLT